MKIYYDTEFNADGRTIDLLSIGMVREDGATYYAVSADADYERAAADPWLRQNVLSWLPMRTATTIDRTHDEVKSRTRIRDDVAKFVTAVPDPELWAWYGAYDFVALVQLFVRMIDLPPGFPEWTNDLRQEARRLGDPKLPEQEGMKHHALADAMQDRAWGAHLDTIRSGVAPEMGTAP